MKKKTIFGSKSGITLIETLVALIILASGLAGAATLIVHSMKLSDLSSEKNIALAMARNRFERMSMSDFNDLPSWSINNMVCDQRGNPNSEGNYRLSTIVTHPLTNLTEIVVQVSVRNHQSLEFDNAPFELMTQRADY